MAQHKSARKRIRRNARANQRNHEYLTSVRTAIKRLRTAVAGVTSGAADKSTLAPLLLAAQTRIAKAAAKGILHKNNASRRIGRLAKAVQGVDKAPVATEKKPAAAKKAPARKTSAAAKKSK